MLISSYHPSQQNTPRASYRAMLRARCLEREACCRDADSPRSCFSTKLTERDQDMLPGLERYFEFEQLGTNWRTEILAGLTTFVTMAYIVFVNPSVLHEAGMPFKAVVAATCFCAAFGSIAMGAFARYPIALAPGMGLNAYFTYTVVKGMGVPWETALGAVFLSGVAFLILTLLGIRQLIFEAIPQELYAAVASGIGLFIAVIGLRNSGIIVASPATLVTLGNLRDKNTLVAVAGLLMIAGLLAWNVKGAMLIGILSTTLLAALCGLTHWTPETYRVSDISATFGKLNVQAAWSLGFARDRLRISLRRPV